MKETSYRVNACQDGPTKGIIAKQVEKRHSCETPWFWRTWFLRLGSLFRCEQCGQVWKLSPTGYMGDSTDWCMTEESEWIDSGGKI